jgi:hypothetical protein
VAEPIHPSEPVRSQPTSFPPAEAEAPRSSRRISSHAELRAIGQTSEAIDIPSPAAVPQFPGHTGAISESELDTEFDRARALARERELELEREQQREQEREEGAEPKRKRVATRPPLPSYQPELPPPSEEPEPEPETALGPPTPLAEAPQAEPESVVVDASGAARIRGVSLADVPGLQDLPPEAQVELVGKAKLEKLDVDEEVSSFAVALVIEGWASISPSIADVSCAFAQVGQVVFARGTLAEGVALRIVAGETDTLVATWDEKALEEATADCPWVGDELRVVADRFQALAGAAMGPLGERLDDTLRQSVTDRCQVKTLLPGDVIVTEGKAVPGMFIVAAGSVEIADGEEASAKVFSELLPGDFVFASEVMTAATAPHTARAGKGGALVLFAERKIAHEMMVSVPPLLEILSG